MTARRRRIGLLGGTFDPPHWAHLVLAECARSELALDEVWFLPAGRPPHKRRRRISPAATRLSLLERALRGLPGFRLEPLETERGRPSYTADTLETLQARHPRVEWWLLVGGDMLADLPRWRRPARVLELARVAVMDRTGAGSGWPAALGQPRLRVLHTPRLDLSSTLIRRRVREGRSIRFLVPDAVDRYIRRQRLYGSGAAADRRRSAARPAGGARRS